MPFIESQNRSEGRQDLLGNIADFHTKFGLPFPVDACGNRFEDCMEILTSRLEVMPRVRHETAAAIRGYYGRDSDEAGAARIVEAIGNDFDRIFYAQLLQKEKDPMSWRQYDPFHTAHLVETIDALHSDQALEAYFAKNPQSRQVLQILKTLATSDEKNQLEQMTNQLEKLAIVQYKEGKPVILFLLFDWYLRPNRGTEVIELLEPDCRLIFPYEEHAHEAVIDLVESAKRDLAPYYPPPKWKEAPTGVIGDVVMWAGSQLVSYTVGEAFNGYGFMFTPNILKSYRRIADVFERAGLPVPDNVLTGLVRQYVYHELGHSYFHPKDTFLDEVSTDTTTAILILRHALSGNDEELTNAVALLFGEYAQYVAIPQTGEASSDGYRMSSIVITETLLGHHLIELLPDGRLHIHQDRDNCWRCIEDLTSFHEKLVAGGSASIESLRSLTPSQQILELARSV